MRTLRSCEALRNGGGRRRLESSSSLVRSLRPLVRQSVTLLTLADLSELRVPRKSSNLTLQTHLARAQHYMVVLFPDTSARTTRGRVILSVTLW